MLFRVLFAVTSFFGGAGVIAYLLAWVLIPDHDTEQAPLDRIAARCAGTRSRSGWSRRRRDSSPGPASSAGGPRPAGVLVVAAIILAIVLSRRPASPTKPQARPATFTPPADGTDRPTAATAPDARRIDRAAHRPRRRPGHPAVRLVVPETRAWIRNRALAGGAPRPVRWATLGALVAALGGIGIADAIGGIVVPVYFWVLGGVVLAGLVAGLILRRTPWGSPSCWCRRSSG